MQIKKHILHWTLCLLPLAAMAQAPVPDAQADASGAEGSPEAVHQELGARMMQYRDEFNELSLVSGIQVTFTGSQPLSKQHMNVLRDKITLLDERYHSLQLRWTTFTQAMQVDIADDEELMDMMTDVEELKKSVADTIASKKEKCNALQDYIDAEYLLAGQDTVYKNLYVKAFKLSLIKKMAPQLEKLKAREQTQFAQLQESYQKAQQACEVLPLLKKKISALDEDFSNIQMISKKIQKTAYKPFIQRIKDYLIGFACVAILLLFVNMITTKLKALKVAREQAKKYKEMMQQNGNPGGYPTI